LTYYKTIATQAGLWVALQQTDGSKANLKAAGWTV